MEDAITGAKYIIAEYISDNANFRKYIRNFIYRNGILKCKKKKNDLDSEKIYEMYYEYQEPIKYIKSHRVLALNRGEKEDVLSVGIDIEEDKIIEYVTANGAAQESGCSLFLRKKIADNPADLAKLSTETEV